MLLIHLSIIFFNHCFYKTFLKGAYATTFSNGLFLVNKNFIFCLQSIVMQQKLPKLVQQSRVLHSLKELPRFPKLQ